MENTESVVEKSVFEVMYDDESYWEYLFEIAEVSLLASDDSLDK